MSVAGVSEVNVNVNIDNIKVPDCQLCIEGSGEWSPHVDQSEDENQGKIRRADHRSDKLDPL